MPKPASKGGPIRDGGRKKLAFIEQFVLKRVNVIKVSQFSINLVNRCHSRRTKNENIPLLKTGKREVNRVVPVIRKKKT